MNESKTICVDESQLNLTGSGSTMYWTNSVTSLRFQTFHAAYIFFNNLVRVGTTDGLFFSSTDRTIRYKDNVDT